MLNGILQMGQYHAACTQWEIDNQFVYNEDNLHVHSAFT